MGYFTPKILVLVALFIGAMVAIPVGAIVRLRYARARAMRLPASAKLTGVAAAAILLHREHLDHAVRVEIDHAEFPRAYAPRAGCVRIPDTHARARSLAALAEAAHAVARATLHADGDADFARAESRATTTAVLANLLPVALALGVILPGARSLLFIVTPLLVVLIAGHTLAGMPLESKVSRRALALLDRHGLVAPTERAPVAAHLRAHAALALARPALACLWISWAL